MKNKRYLGFLVITLVLVISMFSNVFASSGSGWTCIYSGNSKYSVGSTIDAVGFIDLYTYSQESVGVKFKSNFEVESGDKLYLTLDTYLDGNSDYFNQAASVSFARVIAENGDILLDINYELYGNRTSYYMYQGNTITDETAGKLTLEVGLEGTGTRYVNAYINSICLEVNVKEV